MKRYFLDNSTGGYIAAYWNKADRIARIDGIACRAKASAARLNRATPDTVVNTHVAIRYLEGFCTRVRKADVPEAWLRAFDHKTYW